MANASWIELLTAAAGGGISTKVLDYLWSEFSERRTSRRNVERVVELHLDPILKTADELFGKLRDLAINDFADLRRDTGNGDPDFRNEVEFGATLYLFAQFWARIAILRRDSLYADLGKNKTGKKLKSFIQGLESRKIRIIDRAWQRAIGEALLKENTGDKPRDCMTSHEFLAAYVDHDKFRRWLLPIVEMLKQTVHTHARQRLLLYGVCLHAMIDSLDPKHEITTDRPGYGNKISRKTRRDLRYRIFGVYMPFVKSPGKYLQFGKPRNTEKIRRPPGFGPFGRHTHWTLFIQSQATLIGR